METRFSDAEIQVCAFCAEAEHNNNNIIIVDDIKRSILLKL